MKHPCSSMPLHVPCQYGVHHWKLQLRYLKSGLGRAAAVKEQITNGCGLELTYLRPLRVACHFCNVSLCFYSNPGRDGAAKQKKDLRWNIPFGFACYY